MSGSSEFGERKNEQDIWAKGEKREREKSKSKSERQSLKGRSDFCLSLLHSDFQMKPASIVESTLRPSIEHHKNTCKLLSLFILFLSSTLCGCKMKPSQVTDRST